MRMQRPLNHGTMLLVSCIFFTLLCIVFFIARNPNRKDARWSGLVENAMHRKAAEEYAREFGWGADGSVVSDKQRSTIAQAHAGESEAQLVSKLREEFEKDADVAASIIRRLSSVSIYERLSQNPSDETSLGILREIGLEANASFKKQTEALGILRKYVKSASEESAGEYSSCITLLEKLTAIFGRIRAYIDAVREMSGDSDYKSAISARYAVMSGEFNRLRNEISRNRE